MVTLEQVEMEQNTCAARILSMLMSGDLSQTRIRTALILAHNDGYRAGLDAAQSIYSPRAGSADDVAHA